MPGSFYNSIRAYVGALAAALGSFGILLFVVGLPFSRFVAGFSVGLGPLEGFVPLLLISLLLLAYGFYEADKEFSSDQL